jgi:adenosylhomocysteinase
VTEVDPVKAIEAWMDGFAVAPMHDAIRTADVVITATGCIDVVAKEALAAAKSGVLLANAGHFDVEVSVRDLAAVARSSRSVRPGIVEYELPDGRRLDLLAEGRLVNLALGDGHPVEIMDISFALQALTLQHLARRVPMPPGLYAVPRAIDDRVARMKLESLGVAIDALSEAQRAYLGIAASEDASTDTEPVPVQS